MTKWLKEPLLHFLVLGALIFAVDDWMNDDDGPAGNEIVVSLNQQENLAATFARTWQRPPTEAEMHLLIGDFIRQEIAYREGQAMQLDRDDIVIRRRMRQKLEMLAEDIASLAPPAADEIRAYFDENAGNFSQPEVLTIRQVYFSTDVDETTASEAALTLLETLRRDSGSVDLLKAGDVSLLPGELENVRATELDSLFGSGFADALKNIEVGSWGGPVASGFGLHLVRVDRRVESKSPEFESVSDYVTRELLLVRRQQAIDDLYTRLARNYRISIEAPAGIRPGGPSGTTP